MCATHSTSIITERPSNRSQLFTRGIKRQTDGCPGLCVLSRRHFD